MDKGMIIIFSAPSGTGKDTIINKLMERNKKMQYSVSVTTRKPRKGEVDEASYFFTEKKEFENMIENNKLVEWDIYCDNYYGTKKDFIEKKINSGITLVMEITVKGALKIKELYPESITIFILPPSIDELEKRIKKRGTEDKDVIKKRVEEAKNEIKNVKKYDYMVINDQVMDAVKKIEAIIIAESLKTYRNKDLNIK